MWMWFLIRLTSTLARQIRSGRAGGYVLSADRNGWITQPIKAVDTTTRETVSGNSGGGSAEIRLDKNRLPSTTKRTGFVC